MSRWEKYMSLGGDPIGYLTQPKWMDRPDWVLDPTEVDGLEAVHELSLDKGEVSKLLSCMQPKCRPWEGVVILQLAVACAVSVSGLGEMPMHRVER